MFSDAGIKAANRMGIRSEKRPRCRVFFGGVFEAEIGGGSRAVLRLGFESVSRCVRARFSGSLFVCSGPGLPKICAPEFFLGGGTWKPFVTMGPRPAGRPAAALPAKVQLVGRSARRMICRRGVSRSRGGAGKAAGAHSVVGDLVTLGGGLWNSTRFDPGVFSRLGKRVWMSAAEFGARVVDVLSRDNSPRRRNAANVRREGEAMSFAALVGRFIAGR